MQVAENFVRSCKKLQGIVSYRLISHYREKEQDLHSFVHSNRYHISYAIDEQTVMFWKEKRFKG